MRKEPSWDLTKAPLTNNSIGSGKKPRAPRTPKKSAKKAATSSEEGQGEDDNSDMDMPTPSKKGSPVKKETLNKVKGARVEKKVATPGRAAKSAVQSYVESDGEGEDGDFITIKDEDIGAMDYGRAVDGDEDMLGGGGFAMVGRGNGYGNGNGNGNGGLAAHAEDEDQFYEDES